MKPKPYRPVICRLNACSGRRFSKTLRRFYYSVIVGFSAIVSLPAYALGPHEVLLLVNASSPRSVEVANNYAHTRNIPDQNIVFVNLPDRVLAPAAEITPDDFTRLIWDPACSTVRERGLEKQILAWVYSVDFPVRITSTPPTSLQGITLVRNQLPESEQIKKGQYRSVLFAGPGSPDGWAGPSRSLDRCASERENNVPLPSMLLGVAGSRGMEVGDVMAQLKRSWTADRMAMRGTVYFQTNDNVRSLCRAWQYGGVVKELSGMGIPALISADPPPSDFPLIGLFVGAAWVKTNHMGCLLAGSVGDHLTSGAAIFESFEHTKLTAWLKSGAAAASGAIIEPYAIWTKFPHARFFVHYAAGCSVLESYFQAIRCPLQILLVGDPLVSPWAFNYRVVATCKAPEEDADSVVVRISTFGLPATVIPEYQVLVDGHQLDTKAVPPVEINVENMSDGYHEVRVVSKLPSLVSHQAYDVCGFELQRRNRNVRFEEVKDRPEYDYSRAVDLKVKATGKPRKIKLFSGERWLGETVEVEAGLLSLDPARIGLGPSRIQAVAEYADGELVRSRPLQITIRRQPAAVAARINVTTNASSDSLKWSVGGQEAAAARRSISWFKSIMPATLESHHQPRGSWRVENKHLLYGSKTNDCSVLMLHTSKEPPVEYTGCLRVAPSWLEWHRQTAALAFQASDDDPVYFFGLDGSSCAWVFGTYSHEKIQNLHTRGAPLEPQREYGLSIRALPDGRMECRVNGEVIIISDPLPWKSGMKWGVMAGGQERVEFSHLALSPPEPSHGFKVLDDDGLLTPNDLSSIQGLSVRIQDEASSWTNILLAPFFP
jgi:uncharacterized protein (TIGR03790 family)